MTKISEEVKELREKVEKLERRPEYKPDPKPGPWYTSFWVWFAIMLVAVMFYLVYIFLKSEHFKIPHIF